jgi:hypothetical protein
MKKLPVILFVLLFSVPSFSQFIKFGVKVGTESSVAPEYDVVPNMTFSEAVARNMWNRVTTVENSSWGLHGGIFTRIKILSLYVQPEIVFTSNSFDYAIGIMDWSTDTFHSQMITSQRFNRLSIPVLFGTKLGPLRFNAGPAAVIQLGKPKPLVDYSKYAGLPYVASFDDMYKGVVWGFQAGVGIDILKKLTFDVRYAGSLGEKFGDTVTIYDTQNVKFDHSQKSFLLSVGIMF